MFEGNHTRYLSSTVDQNIQRSLGTRTLEEFVADMLFDASSPEQLEGLSFQLLCAARRIKGSGSRDIAKRWKASSVAAASAAAAARARLAIIPNRESHPGFYNRRSVGKPQHLDCDLFLPLVAQFDLGIPKISAGIYEPDIEDGAVYEIGASRDGKTWLTPIEPGKKAFPVRNAMLRGLQNLGRIVALPLSAAKIAA